MSPIPKSVIKKNGKEVAFDQSKILIALNKCFMATGKRLEIDDGFELVDKVVKKLPKKSIARDVIDKAIIKTLKEDPSTFDQGKEYNDFLNRKKALNDIVVVSKNGSSSTDLNLLIDTSSSLEKYNPVKIRNNLSQQDLGLSASQIEVISKHTEFEIAEVYKKHKKDNSDFALTTDMIRALVASTMAKMGYNPEAVIKSGNYGMPREDLEQLIHSKTQENANVGTNNPEAVGLGIWETILKKYALNEVFDKQLRDAHLKGQMHIHDLGYITRVYCSGHSPAFIKKYGLHLDNLDTCSNPPKEAIALSGLLSTFLASMQAYYAGALGLSYLNLEFAPYVVGMDKENLDGVVSGVREAIKNNFELKDSLEKMVGEYALLKEGAETLLKVDEKKISSVFKMISSELKDKNLVKELNLIKKDYLNMKDTSKVFFDSIDDERIRELISKVSKGVDKDLLGDFNYVMKHYADMKQIAQNLIFTQSQSAFSRGGQTLFIDFNLHTEVPNMLKDIPIICPGGTYRICNEDGSNVEILERIIDKNSEDGLIYKDKEGNLLVNRKREFNRKLLKSKGKRFVTYKDFEKESQQFLDSLLDVYYDGDAVGKMFAFPKCDVHVDENSFKNENSKRLLKKTCEVAAKNSSAYFIFDRDAVTMAACCRLKTSIDPSKLEHPESLRFCGFQNVTINIPQAAYRAIERGKGNLNGLIDEVISTMDLAYKAHVQKREFSETLMKPGMPLWQIGKPSLDGQPYVNLDEATYIIGMLGLNEAIKIISGKELHESEEVLQMGERLIAAMYKRKELYNEETGWKFSIEESPAESAARNLAKRDLNHEIYGEYAKQVIQGTEEDPYYTNSVHYRADAEGVSGIDRVRDLSRFHPMIESGAIIHLFTGETEMDSDSLFDLVQKTYEETMCNQFTVSGAHTSCKDCGAQSRGFLDSCPKCKSNELNHTEKVVGYNSKVANWNPSKQEEARARERGNYSINLNELKLVDELELDPSKPYLKAVVYGKAMCGDCHELEETVKRVVKDKGYEGKIKVEFVDLKENDVKSYENLARASRSGMNLGVIPALRMEYGQQSLNIPLDEQKIISAEHGIKRDPETFKLVPTSKNVSEQQVVEILEEANGVAKNYFKK